MAETQSGVIVMERFRIVTEPDPEYYCNYWVQYCRGGRWYNLEPCFSYWGARYAVWRRKRDVSKSATSHRVVVWEEGRG